MARNNLIIKFILLITCISLAGCGDIKINHRSKDYTDYKLNVEERPIKTSDNPENVRMFTSGNPIVNKQTTTETKDILLKSDDKVSITDDKGYSRILTYKQLAEEMSDKLVYDFKDYRMSETLNFNYTQTSELQLNGVYINETVDTVRKADQYYRDDKRTVGRKSFYRTVEAIKYRNKAENDIIKGIFTTREKNKNVDLSWDHLEYDIESDDIKNFLDDKELNFIKLTGFYKFDDFKNFKAKGTATLRDFLTWTTVKNSGIRTLRDDEVEITRDVIEKGVTTEQKQRIKPLNAPFEFIIAVSSDSEDNVIIEVTADLTNALKTYYKVYENYDIINADYKINIIRYAEQEEVDGEEEDNSSDDSIPNDATDNQK